MYRPLCIIQLQSAFEVVASESATACHNSQTQSFTVRPRLHCCTSAPERSQQHSVGPPRAASASAPVHSAAAPPPCSAAPHLEVVRQQLGSAAETTACSNVGTTLCMTAVTRVVWTLKCIVCEQSSLCRLCAAMTRCERKLEKPLTCQPPLRRLRQPRPAGGPLHGL